MCQVLLWTQNTTMNKMDILCPQAAYITMGHGHIMISSVKRNGVKGQSAKIGLSFNY